MKNRLFLLGAALPFILAACGSHTLALKVTDTNRAEQQSGPTTADLSKGGAQNINVGNANIPGAAGSKGSRTVALGGGGGGGGDPKCATNSNPEQGFTATTLKWGTIIPETGALAPLGQQTARVMKAASEKWLNGISKIPGPYPIDWGCSQRPGVFGRKVSLTVFSLNANTDAEALAGMRRLILQDKVFLVRDCYLESNIMGSAVDFQNQQKVPGTWCFDSNALFPSLSYPDGRTQAWNYAPGVDPLKIAAIHVGYLIKTLEKKKLAILADPAADASVVPVTKRVAQNLGHPIDCVVHKKAQEASNGEDAEVSALSACYGGGGPDAVIALDPLNGVFGPISAKDKHWQWACTTCWIQSLAELCGPACANPPMITDCQALPCIPWADKNTYPAAKVLEDLWTQSLSADPPDILTYGPAAITGGLGLWLGMTGPNLSREGLRNTLGNLRDWDAGIGPILNTSSQDHFGGKSLWLMKFCGSESCDPQHKVPWFSDVTGRFLRLDEVGVSEAWTRYP